jgi:hypothetical protein
MKKAFLLFILFGPPLESAFAQSESIPLRGSSAFDRLIGLNGGQVPYPFGKLVQLISDHASASVGLVYTENGRSLNRFAVNSESPRLIAAPIEPRKLGRPSTIAGSSVRDALSVGEVFVAYAEKTESLEVVSFNREMGRYEFQVVKNYSKSGNRALEYASREMCMSCHQNGGPIWTQYRWGEIRSYHALPDQIKNRLKLPDLEFSGAFSGWDTHMRGVHEAVLAGNARLNALRILEQLCGQDSHCIDTVIRSSILRALGSSFESPELNKIFARANRKGLKLEFANLENLDPEVVNTRAPLPKNFDPMAIRPSLSVKWVKGVPGYRGAEAGHPIRNIFRGPGEVTIAKMTTIDFLVELEPLLPKRMLFDVVAASKDVKTLTKKIQTARFSLRVDSNFAEVIGDHIASLAGMKWKPTFASGAAYLNTPVLSGDQFRRMVSKDPVIQKFRAYCLECHVGQSDARMNFMEGTDDEVARRIRENPGIAARLDYQRMPLEKQMPPIKSPQRIGFQSDPRAHEELTIFVGEPCENIMRGRR